MATAGGGLTEAPDPGRFERRQLVIEPERPLAHEAATWAGALVLVQCGTLVVEGLDGERAAFAQDAVLTLDGVPVALLSAQGVEPVRLLLIRRCPSP